MRLILTIFDKVDKEELDEWKRGKNERVIVNLHLVNCLTVIDKSQSCRVGQGECVR